MERVGVISLGCAKNKVDTEIMLGIMQRAGFVFTSNPKEADILIVNTCGFIESAKLESIDTILEMAEYKKGKCKKLIVTGCLPQRYMQELIVELPEVDIFLGVHDYEKLPALLGGVRDLCSQKQLFAERGLTTGHIAYLRIADGCDNRCSYCAIPSIRGAFTSRYIDDILFEAQTLCERGVKELIVIAQDTTNYGMDIGIANALPNLLKELAKLPCEWIRVMYAYPVGVVEEVAKVIAENDKIVNYIDLPIQHCNDDLLKAMNRKSTKADISRLIKLLKENGITIRTSLITGFPGETQRQFEELLDFVNESEFEKAGVFMYSQEEGTTAAQLKNHINDDIKKQRFEQLMSTQMQISKRINASRVGKIYKTIVDGFDEKQGVYIARSQHEAPETDGCIYIRAKDLSIGEFYNVRIDQTKEYDAIGELI